MPRSHVTAPSKISSYVMNEPTALHAAPADSASVLLRHPRYIRAKLPIVGSIIRPEKSTDSPYDLGIRTGVGSPKTHVRSRFTNAAARTPMRLNRAASPSLSDVLLNDL